MTVRLLVSFQRTRHSCINSNSSGIDFNYPTVFGKLLANMADTVSGPVGTEQNVMEDRVFFMSTVGAMNTNVRDTVVTEMNHVPSDKFVYLMTSQSGNELSFVSSQPVTSRLDSHVDGLSPRLTGRLPSDHVVGSPHVGASLGALSSWWRNTDERDRPVNRTMLEMEVAETKQMLSQQQTALSVLTEIYGPTSQKGFHSYFSCMLLWIASGKHTRVCLDDPIHYIFVINLNIRNIHRKEEKKH